MPPVEQFWDQYKENLRNRTPLPKRLARLAYAFVCALAIGTVCYGVERLTGSRAAVLVVGVILAVMAVLFWWIAESLIGSHGPPPQQASVAPPLKPVTDIGPAFQAAPPPLMQAYPAMPSPPKSSTSSVLLVLAGVFGGMMLLCCGGIGALGLMFTRVQVGAPAHIRRAPNQPIPRPWRPRAPITIPRPQPNADLQRRQQELEESVRRQNEQIQETIRQQQQQFEQNIRRQEQQLLDLQRQSP